MKFVTKTFVLVGKDNIEVNSNHRIAIIDKLSNSLFEAILNNYPECDETTVGKIPNEHIVLIWNDNLKRLTLTCDSEEFENYLVEFKDVVNLDMFKHLDKQDDVLTWTSAIESVIELPKLIPDDGEFEKLTEEEIAEGVREVLSYKGGEEDETKVQN